MARRNTDEDLRRRERAAAAGGKAERHQLEVAKARAGAGLFPLVNAMLVRANTATAAANGGATGWGLLTLEQVAQIAAAAVTPRSERKSLPDDWSQTGFSWVAGLSHADTLPDDKWDKDLDRTFRTHAIAVALYPRTPSGSEWEEYKARPPEPSECVIAIASTSRLGRGGRERDFAYYTPGSDPMDAWPDILSDGYIGIGLLGSPTMLHREVGMAGRGADSYFRSTKETPEERRKSIQYMMEYGSLVGGEYPVPPPHFGDTMRSDMVMEWARRPGQDRVRTTIEAVRVFVDSVRPPEPTWW